MRQRRFERFAALAERLPRPLRILDIGGRNRFWEQHGWAGRCDVHITLANIEHQDKVHPNIDPVYADATHLDDFADNNFDIVFSNSVIEHLATWDRQVAMAHEVRRVGKAYWVQTPNYWFPMEPHFRMFGWQWLPTELRVALLRRHTFGFRGRCPSYQHAFQVVSEVRLLKAKELELLFPDATLLAERLLGLVKSWIAIGGLWGSPPVT